MYGARPQVASHRSCDRCGAPVLRQTSGVPWVVTVDEKRLTPDQAAAMTGPNRLAWCLRENKWTGMRLVEVLPSHNRQCPHAHLIAHECPPGTPLVKGALW
jgi:hypothetical protein